MVKSYPDIETLLKQAENIPTYPRLLPYIPTLTPPDTPLIRTLTGHRNSVLSVVVTADGNKIISGSEDKTIKVWDLHRGKELRTFTGHSNRVDSVVVTPDGNKIISGSWDETIKVWDLHTGNCLATFIADAKIFCCAVTEMIGDEMIIIAGDEGGMVHFLRWKE
ncbi:WD40 repeat domain-containing protein [Crocosphaera sp.]|uniref:WD40 repeat domain-containing protein n=1 Tax=Crocosphaera sp. TaxID=2729996 RepID=UPI003F292A0C|nr:hypothetical protein [Crocosphaera sp.]